MTCPVDDGPSPDLTACRPSAAVPARDWRHAETRPALFHLACVASIVLSLVPLWLTETPPIFDYPNHLSRAYILARLDDFPVFDRYFSFSSYLVPNSLSDLITVGLDRVVGIGAAGRITLAIIAATIIGGSYILNFVATGRFGIWPLLSSVFLYNEMMLWGFVNYMLGLGLLLCGVGAWLLLDRRSPAIRVAVGAIFAGLIFLAHLVAFGLYAIAVALLEVRRVRVTAMEGGEHRYLRLGASALPFVPPALVHFAVSPTGSLPLRVHFDFSVFHKLSPFTRLLSSGDAVMDVILLGAVAAILGLAIAGRHLVVEGRLLAIAGTFLLLAMVLPYTALGSYFLDARVAVAVVLLLLAGLRPPRPSRRGLVASVLVVFGLLGVRTGAIAQQWTAQAPYQAAIIEAFDVLPEGSILIPASFYRFQHAAGWVSTRTVHPPHEHLASYATLRRNVVVPSIFARAGQNPLVFDPAAEALRAVQLNPIFRVRREGDLAKLVKMAAAVAASPGRPQVFVVLYGRDCEGWPEIPRTTLAACGGDFVIVRVSA